MNKGNLKGMRYIIAAFSLLIILFTFTTFTGYRMLDVFGSPEWKPDGPVSGSHGYLHK